MEQNIFNWILLYALRILIAWGLIWLGRRVARYVRDLVRQLVARPTVNEMVSHTIGRLLCNVAYYGLLIAFGALALIVLGVPASYVLAVVGIIFVLAAVALQQSLANVAATVIFLAFQPFQKGELIETQGKTGTVQEIQLFNTLLLTGDQRLVSLANSEIQNEGVVNHTRNGVIRNDVTLAVSYQANLGQVRQVINEIIAQDQRILTDPPPAIFVTGLADQGVNLVVQCMSLPADGWAIMSDLRSEIKSRFDTENIPFARPLVYISPDAGA
jgi:small conductance mechanosensitive channel